MFGRLIDKVKDTVSDIAFDIKYGTPLDKAKAVGKVALFTADVATTVTGVGAGAKVAKTAYKLNQCGKGAKMVTTFTANAQKVNIPKVAKAINYGVARSTTETVKTLYDHNKDNK